MIGYPYYTGSNLSERMLIDKRGIKNKLAVKDIGCTLQNKINKIILIVLLVTSVLFFF